MKKIIIAPLAAFVCSTAFAADVSVFGRVDLNAAYLNKDSANNDSRYGIGTNGNSSSRLGFKTSMEVDGLTVGAHLEGAIHADDGSAQGAGNKGEFAFTRRATASISNESWGEVRVGRDLTPSYAEVSKYDAFGGNGIGQFQGWSNWGGGVSPEGNGARSSNMLAYYSPSYAGFKYGIGYAAHENPTTQLNRYAGLFADYGNKDFSVTFAYGTLRDAVGGLGVNRNELTFGAGFNAKVVKINALVQQTQYKEAKKSGYNNDLKTTSFALSAIAPFGGNVSKKEKVELAAHQVKVQFANYQQDQKPKLLNKPKSNQFAVGYINNRNDNFSFYGTLALTKGDKNGGRLVTLPAGNIDSANLTKQPNDTILGLQVGTVFKF